MFNLAIYVSSQNLDSKDSLLSQSIGSPNPSHKIKYNC